VTARVFASIGSTTMTFTRAPSEVIIAEKAGRNPRGIS
jgi:hypothetical protein